MVSFSKGGFEGGQVVQRALRFLAHKSTSFAVLHNLPHFGVLYVQHGHIPRSQMPRYRLVPFMTRLDRLTDSVPFRILLTLLQRTINPQCDHETCRILEP